MKLLDDIVELASNDKEPIGNVLRKCLILESELPNNAFKGWLDRELVDRIQRLVPSSDGGDDFVWIGGPCEGL